MTDFFREVDEELRNDRMRAIWRNYGKYIVAGLVLAVAATAVYRFYLYWSDRQSAASGDRYLEALELTKNGERDKAQAILAELEKDGYGDYPLLARFRAAGAILAAGQKTDALKAYDALAGDKSISADLRDYARLQAAMIAVDLEGYDAVKTRTAALVETGNPWRLLAREALALSAWKAGDIAEAAKWVQELKAAPETPQGLRQRVLLLEDLIVAAGGSLPATGGAG